MTEATASANGNTPTVVLVHGGFADSSSWAGVISGLQSDGLQRLAAANPLRRGLGRSLHRQRGEPDRWAGATGRSLLRRHGHHGRWCRR